MILVTESKHEISRNYSYLGCHGSDRIVFSTLHHCLAVACKERANDSRLGRPSSETEEKLMFTNHPRAQMNWAFGEIYNQRFTPRRMRNCLWTAYSELTLESSAVPYPCRMIARGFEHKDWIPDFRPKYSDDHDKSFELEF